MFDGELFGQQMVEIVRGYLEAELAPVKAENAALLARIDLLEQRQIPVAVKGDPGEPGRPGEVDIGALTEIVAEHVATAVAALPPAERGEPGADGRDGEPGLPGERGFNGEPGKDGLGLASALIDRDGNLVLTMTDGQTKELGMIVGKNGERGSDGKDGEHFTIDDFDIEPIGERAFKFKFTKGEICHAFEFSFPVVLDRGVFVAERQYEQGDAVTWAGSLWIAQKNTSAKPDTADSGWRLAVKRGRDGRDAK